MKTCSECKKDVEPVRRQEGPHLGEYCPDCGKWFAWVPQDKPYDPNWVMDFGKYNGTKISRLPTDYLQFASDEATGHRKLWFQQALANRYSEFVQEYMKLAVTKPWEGHMPPALDIMAALFMQAHPKVTRDKFNDYLAGIMAAIMENRLGKIKIIMQAGTVHFSDF